MPTDGAYGAFLPRQGIDVAYLLDPRHLSWPLQRSGSKDAAVREAQYRRAARNERSVSAWAQHIVTGKIRNMSVFCRSPATLEDANRHRLASMEGLIHRLPRHHARAGDGL